MLTYAYRNPAYESAYDLPARDVPPDKVFFVATTPRSGSTLLAFLCRQSGALGFPLEYFTEINARLIRQRLSLENCGFPAYVEALTRIRTSSNGVFSFKLHNEELSAFLAQGGCDIAFMSRAKAILLEREDKLSQATSLVIASQTNQWIDLPGYHMSGKQQPKYDRKAIEDAMTSLTRQHDGWRAFLANTGIPTLELSYESIVGNCPTAFQRICDFVAIPSVTPSLQSVELRRQDSEVNHDWRRRFLRGR
jgi:LPS sulfotransferase NodH